MIIGLTGTLGSGKGEIVEYLKQKGFFYFSHSDELREILRQQGIEITRKNLQDYGNKLREEYGGGYLAGLIVRKIKEGRYENAIVDSIRNPAEIEILRKEKDFVLVAIDAPLQQRFERLKNRGRENDPKDWQSFIDVDRRDRGVGENVKGQQVEKCIEQADYKIYNDSNFENLHSKVEEVLEKILQKKDKRPSWDEYFTEIARAVAKRATCDRGMSGCVIVRDKQILVTGYVGSPVGLPHCDEVGHQMKTLVHEDGSTSQHCTRTAHAEQNAICQAAKLGISINNATLYCKMTPCSTCAKMIINSGIKRVVAEKRYHQGKEAEELFRVAGVKLDILSDSLELYENQ